VKGENMNKLLFLLGSAVSALTLIASTPGITRGEAMRAVEALRPDWKKARAAAQAAALGALLGIQGYQGLECKEKENGGGIECLRAGDRQKGSSRQGQGEGK
jgi:hypothetical protein